MGRGGQGDCLTLFQSRYTPGSRNACLGRLAKLLQSSVGAAVGGFQSVRPAVVSRNGDGNGDVGRAPTSAAGQGEAEGPWDTHGTEVRRDELLHLLIPKMSSLCDQLAARSVAGVEGELF